jgi:hypothetical protein
MDDGGQRQDCLTKPETIFKHYNELGDLYLQKVNKGELLNAIKMRWKKNLKSTRKRT